MVTEEEVVVSSPNGNGQSAALVERHEEQLASNLTLLMPPKIEVDFMERKEVTDETSGETIIEEHLRRARISSYVPMRIFHQMLASRSQVLKMKSADPDNPENTAMLMEWMRDAVLDVWKRTEPKMTAERLEEGLQMDQVMELFQVFFGALMAQLGQRGRFMQQLQS